MWQRSLFLVLLLLISRAGADEASEQVGAYNADYGVFLGELPNLADGDVSGRVYVINETALQIINFNYNGEAPDLYFWLDRTEEPTVNGVKVPSFEFGITPLGPYKNAERVVLILPGLHKITGFKSFGLFCYEYQHIFSKLAIDAEGLELPRPQFLKGELKGSRYSVASGPILVADRRTIKIFGFTFDDGYFFVGRGPNIAHDAGVKVPIRGRDTPELITAMNERYRGGQDIFLDLPENYSIEHIDWLSVYCYKFRVDFGHVAISNLSSRIPPYVPPQKHVRASPSSMSVQYDEAEAAKVQGWPVSSLLGTDSRRNFTFQLGSPGGLRGYQSMARQRPATYVWYVNGYLADIYLKRGVTYNFIIEGGSDKSTSNFYNPLYITDDQFGGYSKLINDEREQVKIFSAGDPSGAAGRLCIWEGAADNADSFATFIEFRRTLRLRCDPGEPAVFSFTPAAGTPDTLYYQSYSTFNMGWKIHIVDELPSTIADWTEEPYTYEAWLASHNSQELLQTASASLLSCLVSFCAIAALLL